MKHTCYHPELVPTNWEQKKPEPCEMDVCGCGKNAICPVCGFGWASYPCDCATKKTSVISDNLHEELLEESLTKYADIWRKLAGASDA